jgi:protein-arginine kinase activator protein McsA
MTERAQKVIAAARNVAEGNPTLGKLIREGRDPMITKTYYEYAAVLREVINQLQQSPGVIMCADVLKLCEELEAL